MTKTVAIGAALTFMTALSFAQAPAGQQRPPDPRSRGGGDCRDNP